MLFELARIIGIDYGQKRVGIAVTDPLKITAYGLITVRTHEIFEFLDKYMNEEEVECLVVGKPVQMNNKPSEVLVYVNQFITALRRKYPALRIELMDERFTSKMAVQAMIAGGMKKSERRKKENIDKISAALILQSFMAKEELL